MSPQFFFVVNPNARGGRLGRQWPRIAERARHRLGDFDFALTTGPGRATQLAREAVQRGFATIVSCGGDGTHNEVLNGLLDEQGKPGARLALLPAGTGGDFRRSMNLPKQTDAALASLRDGQDRQIDIGHVDFVDHQGRAASRYFLNIAGGGMSGLVDAMVNRSSKRLGGTLSFFLGSVRALWHYDFPHCVLLCDGRKVFDGRLTLLAVANGRFFGGGMQIAPDAKLDDALFDVVLRPKESYRALIGGQHRIYAGTHLRSPGYGFHRAREVELASPGLLLDIDGENPGRSPALFRILPQTLCIRGSAP